MRLWMKEQQDLDKPEVTIAYSKMTSTIRRVADFVRIVDQTVLCKKECEEYVIAAADIFYVESVDKRTFVYCEEEVYECALRLYELETLLMGGGFVRVSKSILLNIDKLNGVKTLANSRLEATLTNGECICVTRKYLKDMKQALLGRTG